MKFTEFEPVRAYITALVGPVAAVLVGFGWADSNRVNLICGVLLAILAVPASMAIRSKVTPVAKVNATGNIATDVINQVGNVVNEHMQQIPKYVEDQIGFAINQVIPEAVARTTSAVAAIATQTPESVLPPSKKVSRPVEVNPYA